ncbi:nitrate- and nitrite sensing domain-containing protein [Streptomyces sp.]|uniref:nitrate- and nitrite sensing domain-containing protein n=1 Tax=Streptomyces sp. TaxID=1931 RepID=UPI002F3EF7B5
MTAAHCALGTTMTAPRTVRAKLTRILVVSLALVMTLLGFAAAQQRGNYRNASRTASNARLAVTLQGLIHGPQKERGLTTGSVGGVTEFRPGLPTQRAATDAARRALSVRDVLAALMDQVVHKHIGGRTRVGAQ